MLYRVHFAATPDEPMPDVATLAAVEADSPLAAVERLASSGRVPQDRLYAWARVILSELDGRAVHLLRVPIHADVGPALGWGKPDDEIIF